MATYKPLGPKWASTTVVWSFVGGADPVFSGAITDPDERALVAQAFARWESVSGLHFVQAGGAASATAEILVGFGDLQGSASQRIAGQTNFQDDDAGHFLPGTILRLEDPAQVPLQADASGTLVYRGSNSAFFAVVLHEIGHAIGLDHVEDPTALMFPTATAANRTLGAGEVAGAQTLYGAPPPVTLTVTDTASGVSSQPEMAIYLGPVPYLLHQYLHTGSGGVGMAASAPNVFLRGGGGDDALRVTSGSNVLDGGIGSNFLLGGSGTDTFFLDGRGGGTVWSTVANFQAGDSVTFWGLRAGVSTGRWAEAEGTPGFLGATLHTDLDGDGDADASLTFAGLSLTQVSHFSFASGVSGDSSYVAITFA